MAATYECRTCNVISTEPGKLCAPDAVDMRCDYGRSLSESREAMCRPTRSRLEHACDMCGRPTLQDFLVCLPTPIKH